MTDPTPQRERSPESDRPVMGDHPDLEDEEEVRSAPIESESNLSRLLVPGFIVLLIALAVIAYFLFLD